MTNPQLHPLELNPHTGEPFLRLKHHKNIILTPPRPGDVAFCTPILNDPKVHEWLTGPPVPYLTEHAEAFYALIRPPIDAVLHELNAAKGDNRQITVGTCPVRVIREVQENGEDLFLGDIGFDRCLDDTLIAAPVAGEETTHLSEENAKRVVGDPEIVWTFGDYLSPNHHHRGIMTDAIGTLISDWGVPRMGARRIIVSAFEGNHGSVRVFEKNGFRLIRTQEKESKGRVRNLHVLEWAFDTPSAQDRSATVQQTTST